MELGFDHYLADGQAKQLNVPFFSDGYNWYCLTGKNVAIWITCTQPTTEEITLSYADEHGDPITGLPDAVTQTVTRGEKASFTVAAGPTCDETSTPSPAGPPCLTARVIPMPPARRSN